MKNKPKGRDLYVFPHFVRNKYSEEILPQLYIRNELSVR